MIICNLPNVFDSLKLSFKDIEESIITYKLAFDQLRVKKVEWELKLPMFVTSFYSFIKNYNKIPSQNDFWLYYATQNKHYLTSLNMTRNEKLGLRARIFRTYPSLIRDLHFGLYIRENNFFDDVFYNEIIDIEYGIDLVIKNAEKIIGLNLFTNTRNALFARSVKYYRPKKNVNFNCYEIPIEFKGSKNCGDFFLYSDREISYITQKIQKCLEEI